MPLPPSAPLHTQRGVPHPPQHHHSPPGGSTPFTRVRVGSTQLDAFLRGKHKAKCWFPMESLKVWRSGIGESFRHEVIFSKGSRALEQSCRLLASLQQHVTNGSAPDGLGQWGEPVLLVTCQGTECLSLKGSAGAVLSRIPFFI